MVPGGHHDEEKAESHHGAAQAVGQREHGLDDAEGDS